MSKTEIQRVIAVDIHFTDAKISHLGLELRLPQRTVTFCSCITPQLLQRELSELPLPEAVSNTIQVAISTAQRVLNSYEKGTVELLVPKDSLEAAIELLKLLNWDTQRFATQYFEVLVGVSGCGGIKVGKESLSYSGTLHDLLAGMYFQILATSDEATQVTKEIITPANLLKLLSERPLPPAEQLIKQLQALIAEHPDKPVLIGMVGGSELDPKMLETINVYQSNDSILAVLG